MNIILWILQISLAFWNITGAIYMVNNYQNLAQVWALKALPMPFWIVLSVLQILCAVGLVLPGIFKVMPELILSSAIVLAVISILGIALYISYAGFPGLFWGIVPAILLAFVAYGRFVLKPLTRNKAGN